MNTACEPILPRDRVAALLGVKLPNQPPPAAVGSREEITSFQVTTMRRLIKQGFSQVAAADRVGIPRGSVSYALSKFKRAGGRRQQ